MARYIDTNNVESHLELDTLNNTEYPKLSTVKKWITASEEEVDNLTDQRWDLHTVSNELISPDCQTNQFILNVRPLVNITSIEYQDGDEWTPSWSSIPSTDYRIVNPKISKIKTKDYYYMEEGLRVTYTAGYSNIPSWLKELTELLVEKRYIMSRLAIAAADTDTVSVAVIRIKDKSKASLEYRLKGLALEIKDRLRMLGKSMKAKNYNIGFMTNLVPPTKRMRT